MSESESLTTRILQPHPDLTLSIREGGSGSPLLVLHGGAGPDSVTPIAERYIDTYRVILPTHPGWNDTPRPDWLASVHSLATVYLDLLKTQLGFADAPDQGSGPWSAAPSGAGSPARWLPSAPTDASAGSCSSTPSARPSPATLPPYPSRRHPRQAT